ncbi:MAG: DUF2634 domain-containing protein [Eubacterium sp.]|nr:DUF2634 domain-containing protein [Candidatus Colimonas fimequi]
MSILPSFLSADIQPAESTVAVQKIPKEYDIDFSTGQLTGETVEGLGALKVWIWHCVHSERFRYAIYSWQFGTEFEQYIGTTVSDEYLQSDCQAEIEEALMVNDYIIGIDDFEANLTNDTLHIKFTVETTLGEIEVDEDV